jgi:hypothetical protein
MVNKSLRLWGEESSRKRIYGFRPNDGSDKSVTGTKKSRRFRRL